MEHSRGARRGIHAKDSVEFASSVQELLLELLEKLYRRVWSGYRGSPVPVPGQKQDL